MSGMNKVGAVGCPHCNSYDVEKLRDGHVKLAEKQDNEEETYQCRACGKQFSKII